MEKGVGTYAWFKSAKRRRIIVMSMTEDGLNPTEISKNTRKYGNRITLPSINRVLKELIKVEIVACTDTSIYHGRPYSLTPKGKAFQERISQSNYFEKEDDEGPGQY